MVTKPYTIHDTTPKSYVLAINQMVTKRTVDVSFVCLRYVLAINQMVTKLVATLILLHESYVLAINQMVTKPQIYSTIVVI